MTVVVGKTVEDVVFDDSRDVLLEVYAPWCGHCQELEPTYKKLATRFKNVRGAVPARRFCQPTRLCVWLKCSCLGAAAPRAAAGGQRGDCQDGWHGERAPGT